MIKCIIAGGRDFKNYPFLKECCDLVFNNEPDKDIEIVSGKQKSFDPLTEETFGADYLGERYAKDNGFKVKEFRAKWTELKKAAGPIRNAEMAEYADKLIAFWDGKSRGTLSMISEAKARNLTVHIFYY